MPFNSNFKSVYESIQQATKNVGLDCRRAGDIWNESEIIKDVVSLIDRSYIVICDCTGRNLNVFYEAGIAHTLGRDVILITQNKDDVPFHLRHHRFFPYLKNTEELNSLKQALQKRMQSILGN